MLNVIKDVNEVQWMAKPPSSEWSIQTICTEILNYEIKMVNKIAPTAFDLVSDTIDKETFIAKQAEFTDNFTKLLNEEHEKYGFVWKKEDGEKTLHWTMVRTIQHLIYHSNGISVLRHLVGLPRGEYSDWPNMVDSVFEAALNLD